MARVSYVSADAVPDGDPHGVAAALRRLPDLHVFGMVANASSALRPWLRYGGVLLNDLSVDPLLRELVIMQVGRLAARYEWEQHVGIARAAGATDEQVDALDRGELTAPCFDARQTATLYVVADLVRDGQVPDDRYAALAAHLDEREIVEVMLLAGHYLGLARMMTALRIDPDDAAELGAIRAST
ncbi:carboxymuconolactone decarboxylase family protein [Pseudonocardia dioxanivorans]|uniref:carboxymuconolactone decarboxylase family protein n=1 Tax=Pseudonocardia dioxanivorans TaxID=240495 RepID=UPI000CD2E574|nr:carboxymuconolactone decarboxylase family protein [Pseudonocardia dioxanivorans]